MATPTAGDGGGGSVSVPPTPSTGDPIGAAVSDGTSTETAVPGLAGTSAGASASSTAVAVGPGGGKRRKTSAVWQHFVQFSPPDSEGRNVKCTVARLLPASGLLQERTSVCGQRFTHRVADKKNNVSGSGTSGLSTHLEKEHATIWASMEPGRGSKAAKAEKGAILLQGETPIVVLRACLHFSCSVCCAVLWCLLLFFFRQEPLEDIIPPYAMLNNIPPTVSKLPNCSYLFLPL